MADEKTDPMYTPSDDRGSVNTTDVGATDATPQDANPQDANETKPEEPV